MKYLELVEILNRDMAALGQLSDQKGTFLQEIKDEKELRIQTEKKQEEFLQRTKRIVYPFYFAGGLIMIVIWYGQLQ